MNQIPDMLGEKMTESVATVLVNSSILSQIPQINNSQKSWFEIIVLEILVQSIIGPVAFGPVARQGIVAEGTWQYKLFMLCPQREKEKKSWGQINLSKAWA